MADNDSDNSIPERDHRRFAVSANRSRASHRVRYVETGGASVDNEECTFCQAVPGLDDEPEGVEKVVVTGDEAGDAQGEEQAETDVSASSEKGCPRSKPSGDNAAQTDDADSGR
jgi:hypothetical protein